MFLFIFVFTNSSIHQKFIPWKIILPRPLLALMHLLMKMNALETCARIISYVNYLECVSITALFMAQMKRIYAYTLSYNVQRARKAFRSAARFVDSLIRYLLC